MDYIQYSITNPVKVAVGVILLVLFGLISLTMIPIQLTPNVDQPVITVSTTWTGRAPEEIEQEILEEQEDRLKSVSNLMRMKSTASQGQGEIELEFFVGTNMDRIRQEVSDKLREVPSYPDGVDEPVIAASETSAQNAIAWMVLTSSDPDFDVESIRTQVEKLVKPQLERVDGLSRVDVYGGRERQVHVQVDPQRMAQRGVSFGDLRTVFRRENLNISAGTLAEGRLDWPVRAEGQLKDLDEVRNLVIRDIGGGQVLVRDVATVEQTLEKRRAFVRSRGLPALAIPAFRESGANVIEVMNGLRERIRYVNETILPDMGPGLSIEQVYDETVYIDASINLVLNNLWLGGSFAVIVLLMFLRSFRPTMVVALTIPISVVGTFVVMTAAGRNLNVISLAGLAFAVGMVVDNAIVVLENIDRHLAMHKKPMQAAYDAAREVWGAILASTLTTVAVFVPVLTMQEEAGQLFRDIALAICAAVLLSLIISITVIPTAASRLLHEHGPPRSRILRAGKSLLGLAPALGALGNGLASLVYRLSAPSFAGVVMRLGIIAFFTLAAIVGAALLMPPTTYLPAGNRNLVFGFMITPPAYTVEQNMLMAERMEAPLAPYWEAQDYDDLAHLPKPIHPWTGQEITPPPIENFFFVAFRGNVFYGTASRDPSNVKSLEGLLQWAGQNNPASLPLAFQVGLFGRGLGGGSAIEVNVMGDDLDVIRASADALYGRLAERYGYTSVRPDPTNFNKTGPEKRVTIDPLRAQRLGIRNDDLGLALQTLVDGAIVGDFRLPGENIDIVMVRDPKISMTPDELLTAPIVFRRADGTWGSAPLNSVARFSDEQAPQQISRIEQLRAVTLSITPPPGTPLEVAIAEVAGIIDELRQDGAIQPGVETAFAGTADKLSQVREALLGQWHGFNLKSVESLGLSRIFLALLVVYLLMAALFESFLYPFVILFSVPLATVGGFIGLAIVHAFVPDQMLDVLTMLGFVILIGIVVNNAILLVHQALNFMRGQGEVAGQKTDALAPREAIRESVRTRVRPIFMTTFTSVCGMLPLVLMPGAGSELYRGLGSVVVGGLVVSAVFTLVVVPLLFSLALDIKAWIFARFYHRGLPELEHETIQTPTAG